MLGLVLATFVAYYLFPLSLQPTGSSLFCGHPLRFWSLNPRYLAAGPGVREQVPLRVNGPGVREQVPLRVNSLGMRGAEFPAEARRPRARQASTGDVVQQHEPVALLLGADNVFGQNLREEDTLALALQRVLRERTGRKWLVGNGGVPGYVCWQKCSFLEDIAPRLCPDLLIVVAGSHDGDRSAILDKEALGGELWQQLRLILWLGVRGRAVVNSWNPPGLSPFEVNARGENRRVIDRDNCRVLSDIAQVGRAFGAREVVFLVLPDGRRSNASATANSATYVLSRGGEAAGPYDLTSHELLFLQVGNQCGVAVGQHVLWAENGKLKKAALFASDQTSLSAEGTREAARDLVEELYRRRVLPLE